MRVFVAGSTGVLGRRLVPLLVADGHHVTGMTRSPDRVPELEAMGAVGIVADALDRDAVAMAIDSAEPDVVVHQLTSLAGPMDMRHVDRYFAMTNRLRTQATDHLLAAGRDAGVKRFVAQSFAGWPFARTGTWIKTENDPLDPDPPKALRGALRAIRHVEAAVGDLEWADGVVLRYGFFYGPGTGLSTAADAAMTDAVLKRQFPIVGGGDGMWSFIHVDDAAQATALAVAGATSGVLNVVDDEPAPVRDWLPVLAERLEAKPPRRLPTWLARLAAGHAAVVMLTQSRGAANTRARHELEWMPRYRSWREGFADGLD